MSEYRLAVMAEGPAVYLSLNGDRVTDLVTGRTYLIQGHVNGREQGLYVDGEGQP